jgi:hypothetical protein
MRDAVKPPSLGELLGDAGNHAEPLGLKHLPEILGEKMPELPKNRVGKYRLVSALKNRFGVGFRNIPGVKNILSEFDGHVEDENVIRANMQGRMK